MVRNCGNDEVKIEIRWRLTGPITVRRYGDNVSWLANFTCWQFDSDIFWESSRSVIIVIFLQPLHQYYDPLAKFLVLVHRHLQPVGQLFVVSGMLRYFWPRTANWFRSIGVVNFNRFPSSWLIQPKASWPWLYHPIINIWLWLRRKVWLCWHQRNPILNHIVNLTLDRQIIIPNRLLGVEIVLLWDIGRNPMDMSFWWLVRKRTGSIIALIRPFI